MDVTFFFLSQMVNTATDRDVAASERVTCWRQVACFQFSKLHTVALLKTLGLCVPTNTGHKKNNPKTENYCILYVRAITDLH